MVASQSALPPIQVIGVAEAADPAVIPIATNVAHNRQCNAFFVMTMSS